MAPHWDSFPMPTLSLAASWVTHGPKGSAPMQHHLAQPQSGLLNPKAPAEGTQRTVMFPKATGRAWSS